MEGKVNRKNGIFWILLFFISLNIYSNSMDTEYKSIRASNNINSLTEYYNKKKEIEIKDIFKELDIIYENFQDEEVYRYVKKYENYSYDIISYYSVKITEKCQNSCSKRLIKFYNYLYNKTHDIEIFAMILDYKEFIDLNEYEKITKICLENNSIRALQKQKDLENKSIEEKNIKVKKFNKEYQLIQNYEVKLSLSSNIQKRVLLLSYKDNLYLSIDNNIQKIAENYYLPISLKFLDLNNDNNIEILLEYDRNVVIYSYKENNILKLFDAYKDISLNNYFKYEVGANNIRAIVKDDFGNEKIEIYKLPNEKEIINEVIRDKDNVERKIYYNFIIVKGKIIMNVMDKYFYQIIFDESLNYKLKHVNRNEL